MRACGSGGRANFLILRKDVAAPLHVLKQTKFRNGAKSSPKVKLATMNWCFLQRKSHPIIGPNLRKRGGGGEVGRRELLTVPHNGINEINPSN